LIGAASFSSGVTRAISTAVIVLELTGQFHLTVPMGIGISCSYFIGNWFTANVYDFMIANRHVVHLPKIPKYALNVPASLVMKSAEQIPQIDSHMTYAEVGEIIMDPRWVQEVAFPVVQRVDGVLVGSVARTDIEKAIRFCRTAKCRAQTNLQKRFLIHLHDCLGSPFYHVFPPFFST
jgi:chloride channel 2